MIPPKNTNESFTSVYDIYSLASFKNIYHLHLRPRNKITVYQAACNNNKMYSKNNDSVLFNQTSYVTSENYHALNRNSSDKCIIRSTSTLFYDLDAIVKRHSYNCLPNFPILYDKVINHSIEISNKTGFGAKSEAIVQECATQIKPKLKIIDSVQITAKKIKKSCLNEAMLSSEIFLKDNDYTKRKSDSFVRQRDDHNQKFWSYAKYKTEYTNPIAEEKKSKKRDRGRRTEDPCPCQLFSYACPCTDKQSLTGLAKNSRNLTVTDQITSTIQFSLEEEHDNKQKHNNAKKLKTSSYCQDKPTGTNITGFTKKYKMAAVYEKPVTPIIENKDIPKLIDGNRCSTTSCVKNSGKIESRSHKKSKQIICPNCKEKLEILSLTGDEDSLKSKKSPLYRDYEIPYTSESDHLKKNVDDTDVCSHDPPCELVPVCQILPTENVYFSSKCMRRVSLTKHNPKMIRITKACRHHPPCIVVPSCQRLIVLKNNCEYIPPCLHKPRCVNVPLCVPLSKSLNCDAFLNKQADETDNTECTHFPPYKHVPAHHQETLNNFIDRQFHGTQNTCEYVSEYSPRFILSPKMPCLTPTFSPCQVPMQLLCKYCRSNKSCQYDCLDCKCSPPTTAKRYVSSDAIIYIRDVGCQFRSNNFTPTDSFVHSKTSSACCDLTRTKAGNYYSNYRTLRYEDKYTNPISGEDLSISTYTSSSLEIDAHCPSHGRQATKKRTTGFSPISTVSPFVGAFSTYTDTILQYPALYNEITQDPSNSDALGTRTYSNTIPTKARNSFLNGKHKNVFSIRRKRKSRRSNTLSSRRLPFNQKRL